MKAVVVERFGGPEVLEYRDVPTPVPAAHEVAVEVHAVTVNRALDILVREHGDGRRPVLPTVLGADPVGIVRERGAGVDPSWLGARVAVISPLACGACVSCRNGREADCVRPVHLGIHRWGGYAETVVVPAASLLRIPEALPFPDAAVVFRHTPTAFHLLDCKAELQAGERVLIMGASGGLGNAGVQVAKLQGAYVLAAAGTAAGVALARELGADVGIDYRSCDLAAAVRAATDGDGVDVVFENIGAPDLWPQAFASLGGGGRLVTAGAHGGGTVELDVKRLYRLKLRVIGGSGVDRHDLEATVRGAAEGRFRAAIQAVLPLSAAREAQRIVADRATVGKVVLVPDRLLAS